MVEGRRSTLYEYVDKITLDSLLLSPESLEISSHQVALAVIIVSASVNFTKRYVRDVAYLVLLLVLLLVQSTTT